MCAASAAAEVDARSLDYSFSGRGGTEAVGALLRRALSIPASAALPFRLELVDRCEGERPRASESQLCFELHDVAASEILIRGTSAVDLARGAAHYLRTFCNMSFSWARSGGNQVTTRSLWPAVGSRPIVQWRLRDISYGFNVCTFSYSHVWYSFHGSAPQGGSENWESLIDWMALSGINLALAYTGQEEVYRKVFNRFGINDTVFSAWSNGPAHLAWSRGQSMHGVGGPLPKSWMSAQWLLQRKILGRMRELGITPILPGFQGNVPPLLKELHPAANITIQKAHWGGGTAAWLDATDPLFQSIGDEFMKEVIRDFGIDVDGDGVGDATEHWYEADGYFAAGNPPWLSQQPEGQDRLPRTGPEQSQDTAALRSTPAYDENAFRHAARAYAAMNATDPEAIWMYQGWILGDSEQDLAVVRGYAAAVPPGRLLISDMWAEWRPLSRMLSAAGVPYLYGVMQNFGGTLFLGMSTRAINDGASEDPASVPSVFETLAQRPGCVGIGAFPEGIDQNPAYFTYFFDTNWMEGPADLPGWWARYAVERYGTASPHAASAWAALGASVYGIDERRKATEGGFWREKAKGGLLSAPLLHDTSDTPSHSWYNASVVLDAWKELVATSDDLPAGGRASATLRYDVVNLGREVLGGVADARFRPLLRASSFRVASAAGRRLLEVHSDADRLLCTEPALSLRSWLDAARALGLDTGGREQAELYDYLARAQLTTWLPACADRAEVAEGVCSMHVGTSAPPLQDYANKVWGGLVSSYYAKRVSCYVERWDASVAAAGGINVTKYYACIDALAWEFQHDVNATKFPLCRAPEGDALQVSEELIAKYQEEVRTLSGLWPREAPLYV